MHLVLHTVNQRRILAAAFCIGLVGINATVFGQSPGETDASSPEHLHDLSPLAGPLHFAFWILAGLILGLFAVLTALRYRVSTNLYKLSSDSLWSEEARADAGERIDEGEVLDACEKFENTEPAVEAGEPPARPAPAHEGRLFTPASGTAWGESMLKAFLNTCVKVNCLGRTWRESAERQLQSANLTDPREAELIRRLMQRWQEFHVDPETGVFLEHSTAAGKSRVCVIGVTRDKHTLTAAAFNAGFVVESVGRYLRGTDLVYGRGPGDYHAPSKDELAAMTPGEKDSLIRVTEIPDPWAAMIGAR